MYSCRIRLIFKRIYFPKAKLPEQGLPFLLIIDLERIELKGYPTLRSASDAV